MRIPSVEAVAGHIEQDRYGRIDFGAQPQRLLKTHGHPADQRPAIYVVRDGRQAVVSLYHFWRERLSLADIAAGHHIFGSWAAHIEAWSPFSRPNTLVLRYEDLVANLDICISQLAEFLDLEPTSRTIPARAELAELDGRWIRSAEAPRAKLDGSALESFWAVNGRMMKDLGFA